MPPDQMRAVVYHGRKDMRVDRVDAPRVEDPRDAVVRVRLAGVCGSDLHLYHYAVPGLGRNVIMGHEQVGVVDALGADVHGVRVGDRVAVSGLIADGSCWYCEHGLFSQCQGTNRSDVQKRLHGQYHAGLLGFGPPSGGYGGGQAELVRVPHADVNLLPLPDDVTDEQGVFLSDVLPVAWMANDVASTSADTAVGVWGCGPVGLLALECARARGVTRLFAIDHHEDRLRVARDRMGAVTIDFDAEDPYERLMALCDDRGVDVAIDATGFRFAKTVHHKVERLTGLETDASDALAEIARCVRGGGTISVAGFYAGFTNQFPVGALMLKDLIVRGCAVNVQRYWRLLLDKVRAGEIDPTFVATDVLPLEDAAEAYRRMDAREPGTLKALLKPSA